MPPKSQSRPSAMRKSVVFVDADGDKKIGHSGSQAERPKMVPEVREADKSMKTGKLIELPDPFRLPRMEAPTFGAFVPEFNLASELRQRSAEGQFIFAHGYELLVKEQVDLLIKPKTVTIDESVGVTRVTKIGSEKRSERNEILEFIPPRNSTAAFTATPLVTLNTKSLVDVYGAYLTSELAVGGTAGTPIARSMQPNLAATVQAALGLKSDKNVSHTGLWGLVWRNYFNLRFTEMAEGSEVLWTSAGAAVEWAGTVGSAGKSYLANDSDIQAGLVVYLELQSEEARELAPAMSALLSIVPVMEARYSVDANGVLVDVQGETEVGTWDPQGDYLNPDGESDFMLICAMFRAVRPVRVIVLTEREADMPAADLPLGNRELASVNAPVSGNLPGDEVPFDVFGPVGCFSRDKLQRALMLLAQAIPDAAGCASGFLGAVNRATSPCWMGPFYCENPNRTAAVTATGHQGKISLIQGSTVTSTLQRAWSLSARRTETMTVVGNMLGFFQSESLPEMAMCLGQIAKTMSTGVFQALRTLAIPPAALNLFGDWNGNGPDVRAFIRHLLLGTTGLVPPFAEVVNTHVKQLFGYSLPTGFLASLAYHNANNRERGSRRGDFGELPWTQLDPCLWLAPVSPGEIEEVLLTGISQPGFLLDEGTALTKDLNHLNRLSENEFVISGETDSGYVRGGVAVRNMPELGFATFGLFRAMEYFPFDTHMNARDEHLLYVHEVEIRPTGESKSAGSISRLLTQGRQVVMPDIVRFRSYFDAYREPDRPSPINNLARVVDFRGPGQLQPPRDFVYTVGIVNRKLASVISRARGDADRLREFSYIRQRIVTNQALTYAPYEAPALLAVGFDDDTGAAGPVESERVGNKRKRTDAAVMPAKVLKPAEEGPNIADPETGPPPADKLQLGSLAGVGFAPPPPGAKKTEHEAAEGDETAGDDAAEDVEDGGAAAAAADL